MIEADYRNTSLSDYTAMLKRRKLPLLLPAAIIIPFTLMLAFGIPATYQSEATILIEEQEIPQDFVRTTIGSFAAQQIQVISQRVLTVENINEIIERFGLYQQGDSLSNIPGAELASKFRDNVLIDLVSADVIDPRSGRPTQATIAFTLAFIDQNAVTAQKVADELVNLFLAENLRDRVDQVASTEEFLNDEAEQLNQELLTLEQRLADFKIANEGSLPESYQFNLSTLERANREHSDVQRRIQELEKSKIELSAKLSQVSPSAPVVLATGETVLSSSDRLKALQTEYQGKAAIYRDNHPDVIRLEREIRSLQAELGAGPDVDDLRRQLLEQQQKLSDLQTKYKDNHQDIQNTRNRIAQLESSIRNARSAARAPKAPVADNPAYVLLDTQLSALDSELRSLRKLEGELTSKIDQYEELLRKAPIVEKDYQALQRDYQNATVNYQDIKNKQREAAVSRKLEREQKGQRFTLVEPPAVPSVPVSPNRPAIIFLGFVLAAGFGVGLALLREVMDGAIHGAKELAAVMGEAPLVVIGYIDNNDDVMRQQRAWKIGLGGALAAGLLFMLYLHHFYKPLDVLYFIAMSSLGLG
jgi:succinoglycan biosynthesis transport protein ExoP